MKLSNLGKALLAVIGIASPKLAADSKLPELVGNADRKTFKKDDVTKQLLAIDSDLDAEQLDNVIDAVLGVEQNPEPMEIKAAADETPEDKIRGMLAGKVEDDVINAILAIACPPAADEEVTEEKLEAAMDAMRKEFIDAANARKDVADIVGDLDVAMDAQAVYAFALDHLSVDHKDVTGVTALRALFKAASNKKTVVAQDASLNDGLDKRFPNLGRFGRA
jgi:hypothetical protein